MKTCLKYVVFGDQQMDFVPRPIEFGVKFKFLLKIYAMTWKDSWKNPIWWPLDGFCSLVVKLGVKFNFLLKINANYMKRWWKYVLFCISQMCFHLPSFIKLSPKLKLKFKMN